MQMSIHTMFKAAGIVDNFFTSILFDALGTSRVTDDTYAPTQADWDSLFRVYKARWDAIPQAGHVDPIFGEITQEMRARESNDFHSVFAKIKYCLEQFGCRFGPTTHSSD